MENIVAKAEVFEGQLSLGNDVNQIVSAAKEMNVDGEDGRALAREWLVTIKQMKETVVSKWKPFKQDAKTILDRIRKQEKEMLEPLEEADRAIRTKLEDSVKREEEENRKKAEKLRELARIAAEERLAEATEASESGNNMMADMALVEAEVYERASMSIKADGITKTKGLQYVTRWDVKITDPDKVPIIFSGIELRPVDVSAVTKLVRASKGKIQIPGVEVEEVKTTRLR